jgi:dTDP-4-dehydrorhamnose reductase
MPAVGRKAMDRSRERWLVVGAAGQLGTDLMRALTGEDVVGVDLPDIDITRPASVAATLAAVGPSVVINAAATTAVDAAEKEPLLAWAVNAEGPGLLARECANRGATLLQVSTDYVFDRAGVTQPHEVDAPTSPRSVYGQSKLAGEKRVRRALAEHYVVRTAWLYGSAGTNFVKTMARLERERDAIHVVDDQWGTPTWSRDLAHGLIRLAWSRAPFGTYHCTNAGMTTWYGFARAIFVELGADPARVRPCSTAEFPRPAPRPPYSVLSDAAWRTARLEPLRPWRHALAAAFADHGDALRGDAVDRAPSSP